MITQINYETIFPIWQNYLWPERRSKITSTSAMKYLGEYNIDNMNFTPNFLAYFIDDNTIAGVNSGHKCSDNGYRSRGLYVFPEFRKKGIGILLLKDTIKIAKKESCHYIWSYPKQTSWTTYQKAGFELSSPWEISELGHNAYCIQYL